MCLRAQSRHPQHSLNDTPPDTRREKAELRRSGSVALNQGRDTGGRCFRLNCQTQPSTNPTVIAVIATPGKPVDTTAPMPAAPNASVDSARIVHHSREAANTDAAIIDSRPAIKATPTPTAVLLRRCLLNTRAHAKCVRKRTAQHSVNATYDTPLNRSTEFDPHGL